MFESKLLESNLPTEIFGKKIFSFDKIDSTNNLAKILAELGHSEGTVVISDVQTQGRGRQGKEWLSESSKNLLFSVVLRPKIDREKIQLITFFLANSVAGIIEKSIGLNIRLKWPNDLLINDKKFCGILSESFLKGEDSFIIAGIGINVNQEQFPPELSNATSLFLETGKTIDTENLFADILIAFDKDYKEFLVNPDSALNLWRERNILNGENINVLLKSQVISGRYQGIDESGSLLMETPDGKIRKFTSGEVSIKLK